MRGLAVACVWIVMSGTAARAQDAAKIGITMGYPASVGVLWRVSERFAVRPEISIQQISTTSTASITTVVGFGTAITTTTTTTQSTTDQWTAGYGVSGLLYLQRWEALRTYVSPRFQYTRSTSHSTSTLSSSLPNVIGAPSETDFTSNNYLFSGSFGVQYGLGDRFAVFGELGFSYTHQQTASSFATAGSSEGHALGTRSGAGVIFFFR